MFKTFFCFVSLLFVTTLYAADGTDACDNPPFTKFKFIETVNSLLGTHDRLSKYWPSDSGEQLEMNREEQLSIAVETYKLKIVDMECYKTHQTTHETTYYYYIKLSNNRIFDMNFKQNR